MLNPVRDPDQNPTTIPPVLGGDARLARVTQKGDLQEGEGSASVARVR